MRCWFTTWPDSVYSLTVFNGILVNIVIMKLQIFRNSVSRVGPLCKFASFHPHFMGSVKPNSIELPSEVRYFGPMLIAPITSPI